MKSKWMNTTKLVKQNLKKKKPCYKLGYCPYGSLVEEYPITKLRTKFSCKTFGHNCPMFYLAEEITE
jgi:hypothetical protein